MEEQQHKPHRKAKEKKQNKHAGGNNPKAFTVSNPGKLQRQAARSHDIKEKRLHVPLVDRLPDEPPPRLVTIVGPPGVGKTTLLKSLIRRYAKETISDPQGPVTVVTSKKQRLTFIECPTELECMVDIAKVADIILLMIDGNYGFEMETLEFLNILAATGMPGNVFGILTHLDLFKKPQALKDAKNRLKHRLWTELYQGAHLFYLSGVLNGRYPDREVHNLTRFLSVMKNPRPLIWRNAHPYTVIDSVRDVTHPTKIEEDPKCGRSISLSGYLRGTNFSFDGQRVHIPGLGDYTIASIEELPDPCPTPDMQKALENLTGKKRSRRIGENERKLHAPMSDRSGLKIDGDALWITREKGFTFDKDAEDVDRGEGEELIINLQAERKLLGQTEDGLQLFKGGDKVQGAEEEHTGRTSRRNARFLEVDEESANEFDDEGSSDEEELDGDGDEAEDVEFDEKKLGRVFRHGGDKPEGDEDIAFADADSDLGSIYGDDEEEGMDSEGQDYDEDEEAAALRWKENLADRAKQLHGRKRPFRAQDLARLMYDTSLAPIQVVQKWRGEDNEGQAENIEEDSDDEFFKKAKREDDDLTEDRTVPLFNYEALEEKWSDLDAIKDLKTRFANVHLGDDEEEFEGINDEEDKRNAGEEEEDDDDDDDDDDDEGDGAFEDLETGETYGPKVSTIEDEREKNARRKEELKRRFEEEDREGFLNDKANARREGGNIEEFGQDEWYDAQKAVIQKQLDINKEEFENLDERQRAAVEGYRAGKYAKIVIEEIPYEFIKNFRSKTPVILGGITPTEDRFGLVQVRLKRHRWFKKILKTSDPLIFSLGWRRFQTMPIYSLSDSRVRNRMLKYTPEHTHCFAIFYGPFIAPNTGFACFQSFSPSNPGFRVAASGTVLNIDESSEIVKKLKLRGAPAKIFKNTAFVKDMFNTSLEVAKFEGSAIQTVSGIRGQIKRALSKPEGQFRATFEDKILLSDIVLLKAWYPIKPHRFYNPVTNLLGGWERMRLTGEVRRDMSLPTPKQKDSLYRPITERPLVRKFNPLKVPRSLAADLPFRSQIVRTKSQKKDTYMAKRAVVMNKEEKAATSLLQMVRTEQNVKHAKRAAKKQVQREKFQKKMRDMQEKKMEWERRDNKAFWQREGKKSGGRMKRGMEEEGGGGGKRRR
ncbi:hypothetical protein MKZ38_003184 [Zalerion maritima]|uniref:Bms1-type G domain-containing protein n=1 Tax=Zalerion maritima TaxID=339359 RepID=A0AAD5S0F7_9PEZI|nr:hypothetical protein MKZ38_003184 [Zalerion maritima]